MSAGLVGLLVILLIVGFFWLLNELFPDMSDDGSFVLITILLIAIPGVIQIFVWIL